MLSWKSETCSTCIYYDDSMFQCKENHAKKIIGLGQILMMMLVNTGMYPVLYMIKKKA